MPLMSRFLNSRTVAKVMRGQPLALSYAIPVIRALRNERRNTGGTDRAEYCYSVFIRHFKAGADNQPTTVMEFGPGDSIGIGLCWLIAGAERYYAMDAHPYATVDRSLRLLDQLVELFRTQATPLTDPEIKPPMDDPSFPDALKAIDCGRVEEIRAAIRDMGNPEGMIAYRAPWTADSAVPAASVDLAYSQAVLEHVHDLESAYAAMAKWVRPGGLLSHQIDFRCHNTALDWNGHWAYSPNQWKRANNEQSYRAINRIPCSGHLRMIERSGFRIRKLIRAESKEGISARHVASDLELAEGDLSCSGVYVLAERS